MARSAGWHTARTVGAHEEGSCKSTRAACARGLSGGRHKVNAVPPDAS
jgi:hypothetical protein